MIGVNFSWQTPWPLYNNETLWKRNSETKGAATRNNCPRYCPKMPIISTGVELDRWDSSVNAATLGSKDYTLRHSTLTKWLVDVTDCGGTIVSELNHIKYRCFHKLLPNLHHKRKQENLRESRKLFCTPGLFQRTMKWMSCTHQTSFSPNQTHSAVFYYYSSTPEY